MYSLKFCPQVIWYQRFSDTGILPCECPKVKKSSRNNCQCGSNISRILRTRKLGNTPRRTTIRLINDPVLSNKLSPLGYKGVVE